MELRKQINKYRYLGSDEFLINDCLIVSSPDLLDEFRKGWGGVDKANQAEKIYHEIYYLSFSTLIDRDYSNPSVIKRLYTLSLILLSREKLVCSAVFNKKFSFWYDDSYKIVAGISNINDEISSIRYFCDCEDIVIWNGDIKLEDLDKLINDNA